MPHPLVARRMAQIQPFRVMELLARAQELEAAGRDVIHMEVGEPDFPTPPPICEAARRFIATGQVRYTPALGLPVLRDAISRFYQDRFRVRIDPRRIIITPGASGALMLALAATTDPGREWLIPDPGYPSNRHLVSTFEGVPKALPVDANSAFQPTPAQVAAAWSPATLGLMVASPANPTGTVLSPGELLALGDTVHSRGGILVVDEIYQGLTYGVAASTALELFDHAFVVNSFSKYFGMTGWRLGWMVVPEGYEGVVERLAQHFFIAPSTVAQYAALAALQEPTLTLLEQRRRAFQERRDALLPALRQLGFRVPAEPTGAFYIYADVGELTDDSAALSQRLIEEAGVAVTPGLDFGDHQSRRHLRIAYTTTVPRLLEAADRMARIL